MRPKKSTEAPPARAIQIQRIALSRMIVPIEGITDLITNRMPPETLDEIEGGQTGRGAKRRPFRDPQKECKSALYEISEGVYGFPASGIKKALVAAGGRFAGEKMTELRGVLNIEGDLLPIRAREGPVMRKDRVVFGGANKVTSIAYRPSFRGWQIDVPIIFNSALITQETILNLFQIARFSVGIGCWRPERSGNFGQFRLREGRKK